MFKDQGNGALCFESEADAESHINDHVLYGIEEEAARLCLSAFRAGYDAKELDAYDTLSQGLADDLKLETGGYRYWLSRTGVADGEPFENTITIETQDGAGHWRTVAKYDGGEVFPGECEDCGTGGLDPDLQREGEDFLLCDECRDKREEDRGRFVVEIEPGNAAMSEGGHVAIALRELAGRLDFTDWSGEGSITDANGNTVGRWTFHDHNG